MQPRRSPSAGGLRKRWRQQQQWQQQQRIGHRPAWADRAVQPCLRAHCSAAHPVEPLMSLQHGSQSLHGQDGQSLGSRLSCTGCWKRPAGMRSALYKPSCSTCNPCASFTVPAIKAVHPQHDETMHHADWEGNAGIARAPLLIIMRRYASQHAAGLHHSLKGSCEPPGMSSACMHQRLTSGACVQESKD